MFFFVIYHYFDFGSLPTFCTCSNESTFPPFFEEMETVPVQSPHPKKLPEALPSRRASALNSAKAPLSLTTHQATPSMVETQNLEAFGLSSKLCMIQNIFNPCK